MLKLSARPIRLLLVSRSQLRSAGWSGVLTPSTRGTSCDVLLRSLHVEHKSRGYPRPLERTHTSWSYWSGVQVISYLQPFRVRTGGFSWIKKGGYS